MSSLALLLSLFAAEAPATLSVGSSYRSLDVDYVMGGDSDAPFLQLASNPMVAVGVGGTMGPYSAHVELAIGNLLDTEDTIESRILDLGLERFADVWGHEIELAAFHRQSHGLFLFHSDGAGQLPRRFADLSLRRTGVAGTVFADETFSWDLASRDVTPDRGNGDSLVLRASAEHNGFDAGGGLPAPGGEPLRRADSAILTLAPGYAFGIGKAGLYLSGLLYVGGELAWTSSQQGERTTRAMAFGPVIGARMFAGYSGETIRGGGFFDFDNTTTKVGDGTLAYYSYQAGLRLMLLL